MELFGQKLAELRKEKGLSQDELAADLHISQASVSNYENGNRKIDIEILQKVCNYFNVPLSYMLSDEKLVFNTVENYGDNSGNIAHNIYNSHTDKLIELYDLRLKEKDELILFLKQEIAKLSNK